ncbi:hypothetical protein L6452_02517 [Arctium lappa]|uniref:Uncharacterized protein n=1 Tax=Arctium lappa TaxID=4217 RepID=A0ACB9FJ53_ARCLA|nr:hypothetical protein L6452_02517 [Arctium lappa]
MFKDLLSMGSQSKPPFLSIGEYPQWKKRMAQFLNHKNREYMQSIIGGPVSPVVTVPGQPATETSPEILVRYVPKSYEYYSEKEKAQEKIDEEALIYLTMAIPNNIYNRGFRAKEGEALVDTYNRFNMILNDLRWMGMNKYVSKINYKFIKNLNPEWKSYAINLQMSKNMDLEDVNDIFTTLCQHEDEVKVLSEEKKMVKESMSLLDEKKSVRASTSFGSKSKSKLSKAYLTELPTSSFDSSVEEKDEESDEDIKRFAENLALITKQFNKRFGKKKYYSRPKFEGYKKDRTEKYNPRYDKGFGKKEERNEEKKEEKIDLQSGRCFNCGKFGHFSKDCKFKKIKNLEYYAKKSMFVKKKEEGKVIMAEEENWLCESSDEEEAHFT